MKDKFKIQSCCVVSGCDEVAASEFSRHRESMSEEKEFYRSRGYRKKSVERKNTTPFPAYPKGMALSDKNIVYLHVHCDKQPKEIVAAYPGVSTLAGVHLALAHYFQNPAPIDAELEKERALYSLDALSGSPLSLPKVGLRSLVETS